MIEKVRLKTQIIWYFPSILIVVKITRPLRSYRTPNEIVIPAKKKIIWSTTFIIAVM